MSRGAFTLIELLVVVSIVILLAGLLLMGAGTVRFKARVLQTGQRLEQVLAAAQSAGTQAGTAAFLLQRDAALGGTVEFLQDLGSNTAMPPGGVDRWHRCYPDPVGTTPSNPVVAASDPAAVPIWAHPWGRRRDYFVRESWYLTPLGLPAGDPDDPALSADARASWYGAWRVPERHGLRELSARASVPLLRRIGVIPTTDEAEACLRYADRGTGRPWNDAWGNPLAVGYALFQPPRCQLPTIRWGSAQRAYPADFYLRQALAAHQHNRALYLAAAAAGPELDGTRFPSAPAATGSGYAGWSETADRIFAQAAEAASAPYGPGWNEGSFDQAPWSGSKLTDAPLGGARIRALISAPVEIR